MTSIRTIHALFFLLPIAACASRAPSPNPSTLKVDQSETVTGVSDTGADLGVVAIDVGGEALCTGALIAPDVVLTARHCVASTAEAITCPATGPQIAGERPPSSLRILVGDEAATAREVARGLEVLEPATTALCDADIALVLLDHEVDEVQPFDVSGAGVAVSDHVTAVGFGRRADGDPPGTKLLREHVEVLALSPTEFHVGEATCQGDSGGPAFDETTGAIVGVVSRGGSSCEGPDAHNIYTRADAFLPLIDEALGRSAAASAGDAGADGGKKRKSRDGGAASKPKSDMGKTCATSTDCASGICVTDPAKQYCSRACGTHDRCPAHFHCTATGPSAKVCLET